jgi:hypothetical protein
MTMVAHRSVSDEETTFNGIDTKFSRMPLRALENFLAWSTEKHNGGIRNTMF